MRFQNRIYHDTNFTIPNQSIYQRYEANQHPERNENRNRQETPHVDLSGILFTEELIPIKKSYRKYIFISISILLIAAVIGISITFGSPSKSLREELLPNLLLSATPSTQPTGHPTGEPTKYFAVLLLLFLLL